MITSGEVSIGILESFSLSEITITVDALGAAFGAALGAAFVFVAAFDFFTGFSGR